MTNNKNANPADIDDKFMRASISLKAGIAQRHSLFWNTGELTTNRRENQAIGQWCLHLLQARLIDIKTLMIQQELDGVRWLEAL